MKWNIAPVAPPKQGETLSIPVTEETELEGAWIVYDWDRNAYPISLHPTELEARRKSDELGYGRVKFWKWGEWENDL